MTCSAKYSLFKNPCYSVVGSDSFIKLSAQLRTYLGRHFLLNVTSIGHKCILSRERTRKKGEEIYTQTDFVTKKKRTFGTQKMHGHRDQNKSLIFLPNQLLISLEDFLSFRSFCYKSFIASL